MDQKPQNQSDNLSFDNLQNSILNADFDSDKLQNRTPAQRPQSIDVKIKDDHESPRFSEIQHALTPETIPTENLACKSVPILEKDQPLTLDLPPKPGIQRLQSPDDLIIKLPDDYDTHDACDDETEALRNHPALVGRYHIVRLLGRGSQGSMWLAKNKSGIHVAIKAMRFDTLNEWKSSELFIREIETLKSMHIAGTPQYLDAIDASTATPPYYFLVQTLIPGETLEDLLNDEYVFSPEDITAIALAILPILAQLRAFVPPIVHRDIKPSNIMHTADGRLYLIDFGASMLHEKALGGTTVAGTAGYMAPEQCIGNSGPESDIYSLGATLVHLLTRVPPWQLTLTSDMKLLFKSYVPLNTSPQLIQLLEAMLDPLPARRLSNLPKLVRLLNESNEATHSTKFRSANDKNETLNKTRADDKLQNHSAKMSAGLINHVFSGLPQPAFTNSWRLHIAWFLGLIAYLIVNYYSPEPGIKPALALFLVALVIAINIALVIYYSKYQKKYNKDLYLKMLNIKKWKEEKQRILK